MTDYRAYQGTKVLITGHTGFKGSWLRLWLTLLGAEVYGYSLSPETTPAHHTLLYPDEPVKALDIRDRKRLEDAVRTIRPDIVFHLAAQPLVRRSYHAPVETFDTNIMGTVHLLEACRQVNSVRAIIAVTSDKCYENREWVWGYRENDPMGGHDPYSASKGAAELIVASYRRSFFPVEHYGKSHGTLLASCRAGNVIGGGDWSEDRLIPDIVRATTRDEAVTIRAPHSIRPWQHVLDALGAYLLLGNRLLDGESAYAGAWNFGPNDETMTVREICESVHRLWPKTRFLFAEESNGRHEANTLRLDCSKARSLLGWRNRWNTPESLERTVMWYRTFLEHKHLLSQIQIEEWMNHE